MTDTALQARVTAATAPLPDQTLITDLWTALESTDAMLVAAQLALAQGTGDPAALAALQAQVRDLIAQRDDALARLAAATLAMTTEQAQFAAIKAADEAEIARLTGVVSIATANAAQLAQQVRDAQTVHLVDQTTIASQSLQIANQAQQLGLLTTAKAQADAALLTAQQALTAANAKITAQAQTMADQAALILNLQAQIAKLTGGNRAPQWDLVPTITATFGTPQTFDVGKYAHDDDGDPLTYLLQTTGLPPGFTTAVDPITRHLLLVYDGKGQANTITRGNVIVADDGRG